MMPYISAVLNRSIKAPPVKLPIAEPRFIMTPPKMAWEVACVDPDGTVRSVPLLKEAELPMRHRPA